jgi:hypothetical protein
MNRLFNCLGSVPAVRWSGSTKRLQIVREHMNHLANGWKCVEGEESGIKLLCVLHMRNT